MSNCLLFLGILGFLVVMTMAIDEAMPTRDPYHFLERNPEIVGIRWPSIDTDSPKTKVMVTDGQDHEIVRVERIDGECLHDLYHDLRVKAIRQKENVTGIAFDRDNADHWSMVVALRSEVPQTRYSRDRTERVASNYPGATLDAAIDHAYRQLVHQQTA